MLDKYGFFWEGIDPALINLMINSYNQFFSSGYTSEEVCHNPRTKDNLVMYSTFVVSKEMFEKIMGWIDQFIKQVKKLEVREEDRRQISCLMEKAFGWALAIEALDENTELVGLPIKHVRGYDVDRIIGLKAEIKTFFGWGNLGH